MHESRSVVMHKYGMHDVQQKVYNLREECQSQVFYCQRCSISILTHNTYHDSLYHLLVPVWFVVIEHVYNCYTEKTLEVFLKKIS